MNYIIKDMDYIEIEGYKSIKKARIDVKPINLLIGANGSGKSNFLSFFEFLNWIYNKNFKENVSLSGGAENKLHKGIETTDTIKSKISFNNGVNSYSFEIKKGLENFIFTKELVWFNENSLDITEYKEEASIKDNDWHRSQFTKAHLNSVRKYHFHDTGKNSPFNRPSHYVNDSHFLYEDGRNLAAYLNLIKINFPTTYRRIVKIIQSVAPYFLDFFLIQNSEGLIRLQWQDRYSSSVYGVTDLSDGTIRFIALTTLFMQPNLPKSIIIDEPELGLHPFAIAKLAGMIQSVSERGCQVIIATQSTDLISYFEPEDIITVDQKNGETEFNRLNRETLSIWLDDYKIDDLWKRSIIKSGHPQ